MDNLWVGVPIAYCLLLYLLFTFLLVYICNLFWFWACIKEVRKGETSLFFHNDLVVAICLPWTVRDDDHNADLSGWKVYFKFETILPENFQMLRGEIFTAERIFYTWFENVVYIFNLMESEFWKLNLWRMKSIKKNLARDLKESHRRNQKLDQSYSLLYVNFDGNENIILLHFSCYYSICMLFYI